MSIKEMGQIISDIGQSEKMASFYKGQKASAQHREALVEGVAQAKDDSRRTRSKLLEVEEENLQLTLENRKLKEAVNTSRNLLEEMVFRNEGFARTILHLRKNWAPSKSEEIKAILVSKEAEVERDVLFKEKIKTSLDREVPRPKR